MPEKRIHQIFVVSVLFKGLHALIEVIGGIALYLTSTATIIAWINRFSQGELTEDPNDWIAQKVLEFGRHFSVADHNFYAFYLLSHGLIKGVLVYGLLKEKLWAYPASLAVLGLFVIYQSYELVRHFSVFLLLLTLFDLVVMWFIWREYQVLESHLSSRSG